MQSALVQMLLIAQGGASHGSDNMVGGLYQKLGFAIFINIFVAIVVLATIAERTYFLLSRFRVDSRELLNQVKKLVQAGNIDRAVKLCEAADAPLLKVFHAGLTQINRSEEAVVMAIEEQGMDLEPKIMHRIGWLWSLANIATLIGLFGTIVGLINTFKALDQVSDPGQRQQALAHGISEAMFNTAAGLGIAVVCMVSHLILNNHAKSIIGDLQLTSTKLTNLLTSHRAQG